MPQRESTPCPVALEDTIMGNDETLHPNLREELLAASASRSSAVPASTPVPRPAPNVHFAGRQPGQGSDMIDDTAQDGSASNAAGDAAGINALGNKVKSLVQAMDKLQQLGVETSELPLPKIVVVGDQSAGKSSLVEGLSGIKVPRSSGTCTRCPLQITLTASADPNSRWICRITLQKKYSLYSTGTARTSRYGRWQSDHACEETPFAEVYNIFDLEDALRRAQLATLNPGTDFRRYLHASAADVKDMPVQMQFSPNAVKLDISGPELPNLSFFDLPGIINQTESRDDLWLVNLVKNLVTDYINQESSLILLACSLEGDMQNNSAARLVGGCPGADERTVGVLTKPDRFPVGNPHAAIKRILEGSSFRVGHGYYVTKQPSQLDLDNGISREEARAYEDNFFAAAPWSTEFASHHEQFGTTHLREALSTKLTAFILSSLPTIHDKLLARLANVEAELEGYPEPPANAHGRVMEALTKFDELVKCHVKGTYPWNGLRNKARDFAKIFDEALDRQRPTLKTSTPPSFRKKAVIEISDDEDDGPPQSRAPTPAPITPGTGTGRKRKHDDNLGDTPSTSVKKQVSSCGTPMNVQHPSTARGTIYGLLDVRKALEDHSASDVPNEIDPSAIDHLRTESLKNWQEPMETYLDQISKVLEAMVVRLLQEACDQWKTTEFYKEAEKILRVFLMAAIEEQKSHARRAFQLEKTKIGTVNTGAFEAYKNEELALLTETRLTRRIMERLQDADMFAGKTPASMDEYKKKAETDKKLRAELSADPFQREVQVMASVRGYYKVARLRFLDHVVQGVHAETFNSLVSQLPAQLKAGLLVEAPDAAAHCTRLLTEDADREAIRLRLQKERQNLIEAQQWLASLNEEGV